MRKKPLPKSSSDLEAVPTPDQTPQPVRLTESEVDRLAPLIRQEVISATRSIYWSGPLPPPSALREINDIIPGGAERILAMAEKQSSNRMSMESSVLKQEAFRSNCGLICGTLLTIGFEIVAMRCPLVKVLRPLRFAACLQLVGCPSL